MSELFETASAAAPIVEGLAANKIRNFSYAEAAYTANDVAGVAVYDFSKDQNIPDGEHTELSDAVHNKGLRSQAASLPRGAINHLLGRTSYNVNKAIDILNALIPLIARDSAQGGSRYSPTAEYEQYDSVSFVDSSGTIQAGSILRTFMRTSSTPTSLVGVPPIDAEGVVNSTHWQETIGSSFILKMLKQIAASGSGLDADMVDGVHAAQIPFGSSSRASLATADLNGVVKSGFLLSSDNTKNPTARSYYVMHVQHNSSDAYAFQLATAYDSLSDVYVRIKNNGTWSDWKKIFTSGNTGAGGQLLLALSALSALSPKMDGTAAVGVSNTPAREDHVHPTDTSRAPTSHAAWDTTYGAASDANYGHAKASSTIPKADGNAWVGSEAASFARGDHVHPTDTSRAPLASPAFTGTPTAPTPAVGTDTTQVATAAMVTAAVAAEAWARYSTDELKAPLASPSFTGTPTVGIDKIATVSVSSNRDETNLPVGSYIWAHANANFNNMAERNAAKTVYLAVSPQSWWGFIYIMDNSTGPALAGTWRGCGSNPGTGNAMSLLRRVA